VATDALFQLVPRNLGVACGISRCGDAGATGQRE
jgi:hypothetical protein